MNAQAATLAQSAPVFAALGDKTRLQLIARLGKGKPLSLTTLTTGSGISRQGVAKHLDVLASVGLVHGAWSGRERFWSLEASRIQEARAYLEHISLQWDSALERLRHHVES
jgi:DNA-binding transcriptional ArsR family regulator